MVRWSIPMARRSEEPWPDYIKRFTHKSEALAAELGSKDWVTRQKVAKRKLAETDGRWMSRLLTWKPWFRCLPYRKVGHPVKRWDDCIVQIAGGSWTDSARSPELWAALLPTLHSF